jgi:glycosyltransferase involved in cell wall biosynthesis
MSKVSIIIPSRDEVWLKPTVDDLLTRAGGEIEIIAIVDGPTSQPLPDENSKVKLVFLPEPMGMRHGINIGANLATGKYLMKLDSHCQMTPNYDLEFQSNLLDNEVVVSRRGELSTDWIASGPIADYFYMANPWTSRDNYMRMCRWYTRDKQHSSWILDETMSFSGSNWFMSREHFFNRIGTMDENRFGQWSGEPDEIACKTWLGGGRVLINKMVTHYHLRKEKIGRPYPINLSDALPGLQACAKYFSEDNYPDRIHNFDWLIDHFWPLPNKAHHCNGERYFWETEWRQHGILP